MQYKLDDYNVHITLDDEGDYLAHFEELPNISAFGDSPEKALHELKVAWEGTKASCKKHGAPIPIAP